MLVTAAKYHALEAECALLRGQVQQLQVRVDRLLDEKHNADLRLVRAETEVELLRAAQSLETSPAIPTITWHGPVTFDETPATAPSMAEVQDRLNEVCGVGLSVEEIERRVAAFRNGQIKDAERELAQIQSEMADLNLDD